MTKRLLYPLFLCLTLSLFSCEEHGEAEVNKQSIQEVDSDFKMPPLPKEIAFADQKIRFDNFDVQERLDKELIVNTFYHSSTIQGFKRANRYFGEIEAILKSEGIPDDFKYLCLIESGLTQAVSPSGAKGFWQFMPQTAEEYGLQINDEVDERLNIHKSTLAACAYLKDAYKELNDWILVAASYNRGVNGIKNELEEQGVDRYVDLHLNSETSRYVFRILALKHIFENAVDYGFDVESMELYDPIKTKKLTISEPISDLTQWVKEKGSTYRMLKLLNPWIRKNKLTRINREMIIELPV